MICNEALNGNTADINALFALSIAGQYETLKEYKPVLLVFLTLEALLRLKEYQHYQINEAI